MVIAGKAAETRIGDESAGVGLLVPSSRQGTDHRAGIREGEREPETAFSDPVWS